MYDKQKVIDLALSQVGYHEKASNANLDDPTANSGGNNWNKYARDLDAIKGFYNGAKNIGPESAWCDIFVDWCFLKAYGVLGAKELLCQPDNSAGAGCKYSAGYFEAKGRFHKSGPQTGDQIFFSYKAGEVSHTGLVVDVSGSIVTTVEGNTSDMVAKRSYYLIDKTIYGYGRPDWGAGTAEDDAQDGQGVIIVDQPTEEQPVTPTAPAQTTAGGIALPMLRRGDKSECVRSAQMLLNGHDANVGRWGCDGEFGPMTEAAVLAYQRRNGLEADGIIGPQTWKKLLGV